MRTTQTIQSTKLSTKTCSQARDLKPNLNVEYLIEFDFDKRITVYPTTLKVGSSVRVNIQCVLLNHLFV